MSLRIGMAATGRAHAKQIDVDNLPIEHEEKGARLGGIFLMVFALLWGGFPTVGLIAAIVLGKFKPELLMILIFTVIGALLFFLGLTQFFKRKKIRIDQDGVSVDEKGLFGPKSWTEPFSRYKGLLGRSEYHSGGKNSPSYTLYIVELAHDDKDKTLQLYSSRSEDGHRSIWEDYCRKLNLPAVEKDGDGFLSRSVEDLDKTVAELVREGKIDLDFDPSRDVPPELQVMPEGDELVVTVVKKKRSVLGAIIALSIPSVFIYVGFFADRGALMFGIVGVIVLIAILAGLIWGMLARQTIRISPQTIVVCWTHPWGQTAGKRISGSEIETVRVFKKDGTNMEAIWLSGDNVSVSMGEGLKREPLDWLKNCILKVLAG